MADDPDSTGLGLIVGILAAAVVLVLALGLGPRFIGGAPTTQVTIEAPSVPAPTPAPAPKS